MYSGDYRNYANDSADNRNNHFFMFNGKWRFGSMHGLSLDLDETLGHEERGQDTTEGFYLSSLKSLVLINLSAPVFQQRATLQLWCPGGTRQS